MEKSSVYSINSSLMRSNSNLARECLILGNEMLKQGREEEAIASYIQALKLDPNLSDAYHNLGEVYRRQEKWFLAISSYSLAIKINPKGLGSHLYLGKVFANLERWEEVINSYQQELKLNPSSAAICYEIAEVLVKQGKLDSARDYFKKAIEINSNSYISYHQLGGIYLKKNEWNRAIISFLEALKIQPDFYHSYYAIKRSLYLQGKLKGQIILDQLDIPGSLIREFLQLKDGWAIDSKSDKKITRTVVHPPSKINLLPSKTIHNKIHRRFQRKKLNSQELFVAIVPNGRAFADAFHSSIITSNNQLVTDISTGCGEVIMSAKLPPVNKLNGTVAFLSVRWAIIAYYHWMFDVLPRIELLRRSGIDLETIDKFVFNDFEKPYQRETLKVLGIPETKIVGSDALPQIKADKLVVPCCPFYLGFRTHKWACNFLKRKFLKSKKTERSPSVSDRIYISRQQAKYRRLINEEEVISVLEKSGFTSVTLESMSVAEQALCLNNAKVVVAPHGSGLTNLVFSNPGTKVIELFSPRYVIDHYWELSNICGLEHYHLLGEMFDDDYSSNPVTKDILVNFNSLFKIMKLAGIKL
jgi:capsular polysaccharide biosynthesis protein/Tfp pilus assembly protein PilF